MHMKMKRNNKTDARPGEKGARSFRRSFGKFALSVFAAMAVALFGAAPAFAISLGIPEHTKSVVDNHDGTFDIKLDVTGETDTNVSTTSAKVIVVLDKSGSMNQVVSYTKEDSWDNGGKYGMVDGSYVQLLRWSNRYYYQDDYGLLRNYSGQRYKQVTRLDVAKNALAGLADQLIGSNDSTVQIALETFNDDAGEVSPYYKGGEASQFTTLVNGTEAIADEYTGGTNWADALAAANSAAEKDKDTPTYIVFLSDGKPTYGMKNGRRYGNGREDQSDDVIQQYITDAVNEANKRDSAYVKGFYAIYTGADAQSSMDIFASRANASPNGHAINGSDSTTLNNALSQIVETIKTSLSYKDVSISDTLQTAAVEFSTPDGKDATSSPTFTYYKDDKVWSGNDVPTAEPSADGKVTWDLSGLGKLDPGVKYSVSFKVRLKQKAYDAAAKDDTSFAAYDAANSKNGDFSVFTNTEGKVTYKVVKDVNGQETTSPSADAFYVNQHVIVPVSTLHVTKSWYGGNAPDSLTVNVLQKDGNSYKSYKSVMLNADNNWAADVKVAAGPEGHTYRVEEANAPTEWASSLPNAVTLVGLTPKQGDQAITNTYKTGKLTLKKNVTGNAANVNDRFTFTLTCTDLAGKTIDGVKFDSDGKTTVSLKNGDTKTIDGLPAGKTIKTAETTSEDKNSAKRTTTTTVKVDGKTTVDEQKQTSVDAPIEYGKTTAVTYTNKFEAVPDTGISFSFGPQVALLGVAMAGVLGLVIYSVRKNHGREE